MAAAARLRYTFGVALAAPANKGVSAMLDFLPRIAELLPPSGESWLTDAVKDVPLRVGNTAVIPHELSTLELALMGIVTVGVYFAARGLRQSRNNLTAYTDRESVTSASKEPLRRAPEWPKRGAA